MNDHRGTGRKLARWLWKAVTSPVAVWPVAGGLLGLAVFTLFELEGKWSFTIAGSIVGLLLGIVIALLQRRNQELVLREVTVSVPSFSNMTFTMNAQYRQVAWKLFIEMMTRVTTQPLLQDTANLREALSSVYGLFLTARELLKDMEPTPKSDGTTVELLAVSMLNRELRPFLSKWHPRLLQFEQSGERGVWRDAEECRAELEAMRTRLLAFARTFGELAKVQHLDRYFERPIVHPSSTEQSVRT